VPRTDLDDAAAGYARGDGSRATSTVACAASAGPAGAIGAPRGARMTEALIERVLLGHTRLDVEYDCR